jgi:hypothetical protein
MKVDKSKHYYITFAHWMDKDDKIYQSVTGKGYFRLRNFFIDLGYEVEKIEETV